MVYLQTLNYLPIILIISADKNEIMPICKEKEKYEHMQLIADYADKPSYLQICLFIGRYCRYTDKPIYGNAKSADTDIVSAAYLQIVSADNFIGCSLVKEHARGQFCVGGSKKRLPHTFPIFPPSSLSLSLQLS